MQVGFARVNVNPQMGMEMRGYYQSRKAIGVLDDLELKVVVVNHGDDTVLIMALDNCNMPTDFALQLRTAISEKLVFKLKLYISTQYIHIQVQTLV